jgi:hypothetical protein
MDELRGGTLKVCAWGDDGGAFALTIGYRAGGARLKQVIELCLRHFHQFWYSSSHSLPFDLS